MQRESPTEATVTVHLSIITKVAVVPEVKPGKKSTKRLVFLRRVGEGGKSSYLYFGTVYQS